MHLTFQTSPAMIPLRDQYLSPEESVGINVELGLL